MKSNDESIEERVVRPNENDAGTGEAMTLRALFPKLSDEELKRVADTLYGYCRTVLSIYERLKRDQPEVIDELMRNRRMKGKVDSPQ
jgi:hypothetical protein